jgi:hypothetical protein
MHTPDLIAQGPTTVPPAQRPATQPAQQPPLPAAPGHALGQVVAARTDAAWTTTAQAARAAHSAGKVADAERLLRDAVVAAAANVTVPAGLPNTAATAADIRVDLKLDAETEASTRHAEVPAWPANQWRWIFFGMGTISHSRSYAEAVITHELVHARQVHTQWLAWQQLPAAQRSPWMTFMQPYSERGRVEGPQELEAYSTGLGFLGRLDRAERRQVLRGLFVSFARTTAYTPPPGVTETTAAATAPAILAAFNAASAPVQAEFGAELWWSLLKAEGGKDVWQRTLTELAPIARKGYADPKLRSFYDSFLAEVGLTYSAVLGPPDAGP